MKCVLVLVVFLETFDFILGIELGRMVLNMADNLSASLQGSSVSANEGQSMTVTTLESVRFEDSFTIFGIRLNNVDSNFEWQSQTYQDSANCPGDMKLVHQYLKYRHQWKNSIYI